MNKNILMVLGALVVVGGIILSINSSNRNPGITPTGVTTADKEATISDDVCATFSKEFVAQALGKNILKTEVQSYSPTFVCQYYTDDSNFVTLRLNKMSAENQKKGQTALGRKISTNDKIKMDHFVVIQDNGLINGVYLIINPNLFIAVDRTSSKAASETEIVDFAAKVAEQINK